MRKATPQQKAEKARRRGQQKGPLSARRLAKRKRFHAPDFFEVRKLAEQGIFKIAKRESWTYCDHIEKKVRNPIKPVEKWNHHLVLRDSAGTARFVLEYVPKKTGLTIYTVQQERTKPAYRKDKEGWFWNSEIEEREMAAFQKSLGGMHPADLLISEIIYENRKRINADSAAKKEGLVLSLHPDTIVNFMQLYEPIIERYFMPQKTKNRHYTNYRLNPKKRLVRKLLEAK